MRIKRKKRVMMKIAQNKSADYPRGKVQRLLQKKKSASSADSTDSEEVSTAADNVDGKMTPKVELPVDNSENDQLMEMKEPEFSEKNETSSEVVNEPLDVEKSRLKICRLCLVFIDDNFIPLEKVVAMLQIVLPEVVSVFNYCFICSTLNKNF